MASISTSKKKAPDAKYQQGSSGIGTYATAMEGIFLAEYENISNIFPREERGLIFEATCQASLAKFGETLRDLNQFIKNNISTDCYLAYEIVEIVTNLSYRIDNKTSELKNFFAEAVKPVRETAKTSLPDLLEDTRRRIQSLTQLPIDGSPISITSDVMSRLETMSYYAAPLASILTSIGDGNWNNLGNVSSSSLPKQFDVGADGTALISHYFLDMLDSGLLKPLDTRAGALLRSKALQAVFIANNVAIIDRAVRSSSDLPKYLSTPAAAARLDPWRKRGSSLYLDSWRDCSAALMDVQYTNRSGQRTSGGGAIDSAAVLKGLSSKDRDGIKEKFKSFNSIFDDMVKQHKSLAMEKEVRTSLAREVQVVIEPLYARFWDRYHEIDKGRGKYVKYDKGALGGVLASIG